MIKRIIFKRKNNYILKYSLLLFLFIIILYLISFYHLSNKEYFVIPKFTDKYFVIPTNKEGEVVDYLDKKILNNIDNEIVDFDFKNIDELEFTIQLYSDDNFENINKYLNNLLENKKEIIDNENIFVFYKKTEIGTQYFITYKNYISKNNASEACDLLTIVKTCIIINLQN
ncbi:hypothetical protein OAZ07_00110 [Pelagibacteraceae bacterium]|nr:hypothetical protein [Pelagibacteraceae bacterium]